MQLKSKLNDHPLLKLLIVLLILISSCKKEFYVNEKINPEMLQRNLTYKNGPQIATVNLSQFRAKINQAALGTLKKQFDIRFPSKVNEDRASRNI
ncbi:hypothetical protein DU508_18920 [Pedobacter chinensis]|uniref:Uncharacterized protein n=1 Tax=Pedobacter chinensis TaxID=2282421 RepID=A0A369PQF7_9SPHI|nr:hypothetical protein [Pedobacter chinensis]RDC54891.1 hypothetical protein DU508_18920 [Pedobacter chinensis]